jgi:hypothetical protein
MFSGEDAESSCLEESTWTNSNVRFLPFFCYSFLVGKGFPLIPLICTPSMVLTFKSCI